MARAQCINGLWARGKGIRGREKCMQAMDIKSHLNGLCVGEGRRQVVDGLVAVQRQLAAVQQHVIEVHVISTQGQTCEGSTAVHTGGGSWKCC